MQCHTPICYIVWGMSHSDNPDTGLVYLVKAANSVCAVKIAQCEKYMWNAEKIKVSEKI